MARVPLTIIPSLPPVPPTLATSAGTTHDHKTMTTNLHMQIARQIQTLLMFIIRGKY